MMQNTEAAHKLLNREEVAAIVGCHPETISRASRAGKLPAYYLGSRIVRYRLEDVYRWLEGFRYQGSPLTKAPV
jgi:excisionase family DNA binding protein